MKDSQTNLLPHSEAKVDLLKRYLEAYIGVLGHDLYTKVIRVTDFCCGVGIFENKKHGSPLVIIRVICDFLEKYPNNTTVFQCHFNDKDPEKIAVVKEAVDPLISRNTVRLTVSYGKESYLELLPKVMGCQANARKTKFFHFIDPYGYKDVRWSHIRRLLDPGNSEVLLFQPSSFLFRFRKNATPKALKEFMDELGSETHWPTGGDLWAHIAGTTDLFRNQFEGGFVDSFTIEKQKGTVFCLFFFTSHIKGYEKMLEAKWTLNDSSGKGWHYATALADDLFSTVKIPPEVKALKDLILSLFRENVTISNADLYLHTLKAGFLPKHANQILREFEDDNRLVKNPESRKGNFLINYENVHKNPRIVNFTLLP